MKGASGVGGGQPVRRRPSHLGARLIIALAVLLIAGCSSGNESQTTATSSATSTGAAGDCAGGEPAPDGDICIAPGNATAAELLGAVRDVTASQPIQGVVFGVWIDDKEVLTGALGEQVPGVPATRDMYLRMGNTGETMMATLLLRMSDQGKLQLDDPIAKWYPDLPEADKVTLKMLASGTSGYADYATTQEFSTKLEADPFQHWEPAELIDIAMKQPTLFAPGTSWAFSDTNFLILGQILEKVGGTTYDNLIKAQILDEVGMSNTTFPITSAIPDPVLHAYSNERGKYEEVTYWSPSDFPNSGNMVSNLTDVGKWAQALGTGSLLSQQSHDLQIGDQNVGLGPLKADRYYGVGIIYSNGWIYTNPQFNGYTSVVAYLPAKKVAVVITSTFAPAGDITVQYSAAVFNRVAEILSPANAPNLAVCPRGC